MSFPFDLYLIPRYPFNPKSQAPKLGLFESTYSTVWFQHGIIGIWRRKAFKETLQAWVREEGFRGKSGARGRTFGKPRVRANFGN